MWQKTLQYILGTSDTAYVLFLVFWAAIGLAASLLMHLDSRKNKDKLSLSYWIKDNYKRILLNFILILVAIRFTQSFIGIRQGGFSSFLIGAFNDRLVMWLKQKKILIGKNVTSLR